MQNLVQNHVKPHVARYILIYLSPTAALMCESSSVKATPSAGGTRRVVPSIKYQGKYCSEPSPVRGVERVILGLF